MYCICYVKCIAHVRCGNACVRCIQTEWQKDGMGKNAKNNIIKWNRLFYMGRCGCLFLCSTLSAGRSVGVLLWNLCRRIYDRVCGGICVCLGSAYALQTHHRKMIWQILWNIGNNKCLSACAPIAQCLILNFSLWNVRSRGQTLSSPQESERTTAIP